MLDAYTLERMAQSRLHEARALAHQERLAASVRPTRPPRPFQLSRALRAFGAWLLGTFPHAARQQG